MTEADIEEYKFLERAKQAMAESGSDWVAFATNYDAKKNLSLAKNISMWYNMSALPCTQLAIQKSGAQLTSAEFRECIPRPDSSQGIIIAVPKHALMEEYLRGWAKADGKRNATRQKGILEYVERGVISAEQAHDMLTFGS